MLDGCKRRANAFSREMIDKLSRKSRRYCTPINDDVNKTSAVSGRRGLAVSRDTLCLISGNRPASVAIWNADVAA